MKTTLLLLFAIIISVRVFAQFGTEQIISTNANEATSVYSADIDGDGDLDVLSASWKDDKVAWYENTDGKGNFGSQQIIATSADGPDCVRAFDLDGDGDMDVLSSSYYDNKIAWYENTDGKGNFSAEKVITTNMIYGSWVYASDLDGDGDLDVLSASIDDDKIAWYENTDGKGTFGQQQVIANPDGPNNVIGADLDNDGDMDVLFDSANGDSISWCENRDGKGNFGASKIISLSVDKPSSVNAVDIDGDGDLDVISTSINDNKVAWYENTDGKGTFGTQQIINSNANQARYATAADLDNDGDMDIVSASWNNDIIAWYKNTDGKGTFGPQQIISNNANGASGVYAADFNGDNRMDVISSSYYDNKIACYFNNIKNVQDDQNGDWTARHVTLVNTPEADLMVRTGDIDNLGFGWPENFNPFSGESTPSHSYPWTPDTTDAQGTDRIMVVSSYQYGSLMASDGYTQTTNRPENLPRPIILKYNLNGITVQTAALQIFVDDFQASVWGAHYFVSINGVKIPTVAKMINSLVQTGPVGKLINVAIPQEYLYLVKQDSISILFDDNTTGAGDGYAIDFVKLLVNLKNYQYTAQIYGYITDLVSGKPVKNAAVSVPGVQSTVSDTNGYYLLNNLPAGINTVSVGFNCYDTVTTLIDLSANDSVQNNFQLTRSNTIYSTIAGGYWKDTSTWTCGVVPVDTNDVVLAGPVTGKVNCKNLEILKTGRLTKSVGKIFGDLINHGTFFITPTYFYVYGNIENYGKFFASNLALKNDSSKSMHVISGDSLIQITYFIVDSGSVIHASSDIKLQTNLKLYYSTINMGDYDLYLLNTTINRKYSLLTYNANENKIIFSGGKLYLEGSVGINQARVQGDVKISNTDNFLYNHVLVLGDVLVNENGILKVDNYYNSDTISGDFTNLGKVDFSSDENVIYFLGNIENKGIWQDGMLHLAGKNDQNFLFEQDKKPSSRTKVKLHVHGSGTYKWFKNGQEFSTTEDSTVTLSPYYSSNWGIYYCEVSGTKSREFVIGKSTTSLLADFSADKTTGTEPLTVQFTDQSTGSPTSWKWDFGDGSSSTQQNPSHTFTSAGDYTVALTVSDGTNSDTVNKANYIAVGSSSGSVLLKEHFDGETFPPAGWTQKITNSAHTWKKGNSQDNPFTDIDPTNIYSALVTYVAENQDEWLISPFVDLPSGTISLEFYAGYSSSWLSNATVKLQISTDGGTNWTKLGEAENDGKGWEWRKVTVDLSDYAGQSVMLAWQYVGNDGDLMAIDNVEITQGTTGLSNYYANEEKLKLKNYPNPFSQQTTISFILSERMNVKLEILNIYGSKQNVKYRSLQNCIQADIRNVRYLFFPVKTK